PELYHGMQLMLERGATASRETILHKLVEIQYERTNADLERGKFRVRGDVIEIFPSYEDLALRVELFGDSIESLSIIDPLRGVSLDRLERVPVYPNSHYVVPQDRLLSAVESIKQELQEHLKTLRARKKLLEMQRVEQRTLFDLEMMRETGFCHGIENYSRHLTGRSPGEPPPTLMDYLPGDGLVFVDESHATIPQLRGMYHGDRSRKQTLVEYGFRLPSALDNRPLTFEEFMQRVNQVIYVSATPGPYELGRTQGEVVEQIIRPTGLTDPQIAVKPVRTQVDDLLGEIRRVVARRERVLVTTLTKRMAEDLCEYYREIGVRVQYLHSDIDTLERVRILRNLRRGEFDVLVGVNLLREGLDLPEVSLVGILDADKEGFLRSAGSLIQTAGRASRNLRGRVVMYADTVTASMRSAIDETDRRRRIQQRYNQEHGITPESIVKHVEDVLGSIYERDYLREPRIAEESDKYDSVEDLEKEIVRLQKQMNTAARKLEFERAAQLRDRIRYLKQQEIFS
ncbi:MAG: excinuclease ABC subunit UvrB, partial [Acidobacteriota bacterium]